MKTAKIVFTLLLLVNVFFALPRGVMAQTPVVDTIYNTPAGGPDTWQFSYKHSKYANLYISNIVMWIDTIAYPNVRFVTNAVDGIGSLVSNAWNAGLGNNGNPSDSAYWCADQGYNFIQQNQKDSFFVYQLEAADGTNIWYYPILIHWYGNWATGNECSNVTNVTSGEFYVYDTPWLGNKLDTVTGTSSSNGCDPCDPIFDLTVFNRNSDDVAIDGLIFQTDEFYGTMRPCDIQLPSPWILDSITQQAVYCHAPNGNGIDEGQSLGGFTIGLRANPNATSFSFPWTALSGGIIIDEDTAWNIPGTVQPCSTNSTPDKVVIANTTKCSFSADFENYHSGSGADTVSRLTEYILKSSTPGVTFASVTRPSNNWGDSISTDKSTAYIYALQQKYGQPGGTSVPVSFALNNATDVSPITIQWQTIDSGTVISTGMDTTSCSVPPTDDTAWLVGTPSGCEYALAVKNIHKPTSSIEGVAIQMPAADGTFLTGRALIPGQKDGQGVSTPSLALYSRLRLTL